jgi:mitochondrial fission protein ELM1
MKKIFFTAFIITAMFSSGAAAQDNAEAGKIEFLISSVENLENAVFIRNGTEHDSKEAGEHLRMKLRKAGSYINDADDFIEICSSSYITGRPYFIKFSDGQIIKAEKFFRKKLMEYNSGNPE